METTKHNTSSINLSIFSRDGLSMGDSAVRVHLPGVGDRLADGDGSVADARAQGRSQQRQVALEGGAISRFILIVLRLGPALYGAR